MTSYWKLIVHAFTNGKIRITFGSNLSLPHPPAIEPNKQEEWNYLHGVAVNKHFDFSTIRYVYPSASPRDGAKLKFIPVDLVQPDVSRVKPASPSQKNVNPPEDFVTVHGKEYGLTHISTEAVPAALVKDDDYRNKSDQVTMSPYYYLKHEQLWCNKEDIGITELSKFKATTDTKEYSYAFSSSDYKSIEKTVGHTFNAEVVLSRKLTAEAGVSEGPASGSIKNELGATLKLAYQYQNQTKSINTSSSNEEKSFTDTLTVNYRQLKEDEDEFFFCHWVPVDRYTLTNSKGEVKQQWEYVGQKMIRSQKVKK